MGAGQRRSTGGGIPHRMGWEKTISSGRSFNAPFIFYNLGFPTPLYAKPAFLITVSS